MQTTMNFNSLEVYYNKVKPTLTGRKLEVLNAIKSLGGSATLFEIGLFLNKPLNHISGRPGELVKMGLIIDSGLKKEHNGNKFTVWKLF